MAEIATWSAILNKTGLGKTSNECPTKAELLALNKGKNSNIDKLIVISNASSYGNNECVKLEDINSEQWIYHLEWIKDPSFDAPATGGTYPLGSYDSGRVKQVNGVNTISQNLGSIPQSSEGSWYTRDNNSKNRIVPNNTSTNSRSTTITWTQPYSGKTLQATFTQAAGRKVYSSWSYNCRVDKTSFSYSGGQSNVTAKVASRTYTWNGVGTTYTETETATVTVSSPASISGNSITIPSNSDSSRTFTVTFTFATATNQTITISQEGGQITYVDHLSISPEGITIPASGHRFNVSVDANFDKYLNGVYQGNVKATYTSATVTSGDSSAITISDKSQSGCTVSVSENSGTSSRSFEIKFTYDSADPVYLTISQAGASVTYEDFLTVSPTSKSVSSSGETFNVTVSAYYKKYINGSFSDIINASYSSAIVTSGSASAITITKTSGGCSITVSSNSGSPRSFQIKFTYDSADPVYLTISQAGASVTYGNYVFEHSTSSGTGFTTSTLKFNVDHEARDLVWYIRSYCYKYINGTYDSIENDPPSMGNFFGGNTYKVSYTVPANTSTSSRTISERIYNSNGDVLTVEITQSGKPVVNTYDFRFAHESSPLSVSFDHGAATSNQIDDVVSTLNGSPLDWTYSVSSGSSWITFIKGSGGTEVPFGVSVTANTSTSSRTGRITLTQGGGSTKTLTINVSQSGKPAPTYDFYFTASGDTFTNMKVDSPGRTQQYYITSKSSERNPEPFEILSKWNVVSCNIISPYAGISITVPANPYDYDRSGSIQLRQKNSASIINIDIDQYGSDVSNDFTLQIVTYSNGESLYWGIFKNAPSGSANQYGCYSTGSSQVFESYNGYISTNDHYDVGIGDYVYVYAINTQGTWNRVGGFQIEAEDVRNRHQYTI